MIRKFYTVCLILFSFCGVGSLSAQSSYNTYFVQFRDKANSAFSLSNPSAYLSAKAVERRIRTGVGFDSLDIPVNTNYIQQVLQQGNSNLLLKSKWFNSITLELLDTAIAAAWKQQVEALPFVFQVKSLPSVPLEKISIHKGTQSEEVTVSDDFYGPSFRQTEMLNGHLLHQLGLNGKGMDIAVFDGGFRFANVLPAMDHLFEEGRIIETHDFLNLTSPNVFDASTHGTMVLSHMAGIMQDSLYGTAVEANYYLFQTEDVYREVRLEEDTWVQAAEWADSIGIDVVNSSLGYSIFDEDYMNYSTSDMNGSTTRISQAAEICALKGTLVVNSAGNSGDDQWHVITAPSDAEHVLCIGAVDLNGTHASFSGYHPPGLNDVKPNIVAMGRQTVYAASDSTISRGNGTSFSSPIIAGMAATLWQAFPSATNMDIFNAIEESASLYSTPNDSMGHGIPDFWKAFVNLSNQIYSQPNENSVLVFPQPSYGQFEVRVEGNFPDKNNYHYLYDSSGRSVKYYKWDFYYSEPWAIYHLDLTTHPVGQYYFVIESSTGIQVVPLQRK
jgi:subtilisin family serine protease